MMQNRRSAKSVLIRISYLLPLLTMVLLWIHCLIPHLFFLYDGEAYETMSLFRLLSNTWTQCQAILDSGTASDAYQAILFSYWMIFAVIVSWAVLCVHLVVASVVAVTSHIAFSHEPTAKESNVAKRVLHLICPNRICFWIGNLLPILPALFPYWLSNAYRHFLFMDMKVCSIGPFEWLWIAVAIFAETVLSVSLFSVQKNMHMDLFRLYKKEPKISEGSR